MSPGWGDDPSAANIIVKRIYQRIPDWNWRSEGAAWIATNADPDWLDQWVMVDATKRIITPANEAFGRARKWGPVVAGGNCGIEISVQLPICIDGTDIYRAIAALIAVGALPDADGMVH